jgi:hypothetical protein
MDRPNNRNGWASGDNEEERSTWRRAGEVATRPEVDAGKGLGEERAPRGRQGAGAILHQNSDISKVVCKSITQNPNKN